MNAESQYEIQIEQQEAARELSERSQQIIDEDSDIYLRKSYLLPHYSTRFNEQDL